jgi:hypothetical protein
MPAINVRFTEEELARFRERARKEGLSLHTLAHDTIVSGTTRAEEDDLVVAAVARVMRLSDDLLRRLADK